MPSAQACILDSRNSSQSFHLHIEGVCDCQSHRAMAYRRCACVAVLHVHASTKLEIPAAQIVCLFSNPKSQKYIWHQAVPYCHRNSAQHHRWTV